MASASLHPLLHYLRRLGTSAAAGEQDDGQLLHRFLSGRDPAAFTTIMQRYGAMVWGICVRRLGETAEAEDAFQATFLVLVRKASSLRTPQQLGPWLYGVAYRTTLKLRGRLARQVTREAPLLEQTPQKQPADSIWPELRPLLDEEVNRLPEKYRQPVVLCYLQGMSSEEAAERLRCAKGTIFSRLARARDLLRKRLVRRGVGVSAGVLAALLPDNAILRSAPPAALGETTVRLSLLVAAGTAGPAMSASLAALVEGVIQSMFLSKVKFVVIVFLALGLLSSGAGFVAHRTAAGQPAAKPASPSERPAAVLDKNKEKTKEKPPEEAPAPKVKPEEALAVTIPDATARIKTWHERLTQPLDFAGLEDQRATLADALDMLSKRYNLTFEINDGAFSAENLSQVEQTPITATKTIPALKTSSLATVLRIILARVPSPSGAAFVLRPDSVEITTNMAVRKELGVWEPRPLLPLVWDVFEDISISKALQRVTERTSFNVIVDSTVKEKVKEKVTVQFNNVPVDTAVRLLANMADLSMVQVDNVFYLTTPEKAKRLREEQAQVNKERLGQ
jgi:RNA polymerase sigma factor (sigma-70 family)